MLAPMDSAGDDSAGGAGEGGFVIPCMLLMLERGPRETEELRELVAAFGFREKAAEMERPLQRLRDDGLIAPVGGRGGDDETNPCYGLTALGRRWLAEHRPALAEPARLVARFLDRYWVVNAPVTPAWDDGPAETATTE